MNYDPAEISMELAGAARVRDPTLVRHIYDLHVTWPPSLPWSGDSKTRRDSIRAARRYRLGYLLPALLPAAGNRGEIGGRDLHRNP